MLLPQRPALLAVLCGCLLISLTSCAHSSSGKALENIFAADPKLGENPVTFSQSPETTPENKTAELPADFPEEIPVYPGAKLEEVTQTPNQPTESSQTQLTRWATDDPSNLVQNFYKTQLMSKEWDILNQPAESDSASTSETIVARRNDLKVTVTILSGTSISSPSATPSPSPNDSTAAATQFTIEYNRETTEAATSPSPEASSQPTVTPNATNSAETSVTGNLSKVPQELRQYVQDLSELGILTQAATGSKSNSAEAASTQFEPNKTITRRQFARWLVAANNEIYTTSPGKQIRLASETAQPAFRDISKTDPDFPAIQGLTEAGLIPSPLTGDATAVLFRPDAPLTREQLILWKVPLDTRQALPTASVDAVKQTWGFQDGAKVDPKALRAVLADFQNGEQANIRRVFGYTTLFQPKKPVTQAEAAATIWYFGAQGEGFSAQDALQLKRQPTQPSATDEPSPSNSAPR